MEEGVNTELKASFRDMREKSVHPEEEIANVDSFQNAKTDHLTDEEQSIDGDSDDAGRKIIHFNEELSIDNDSDDEIRKTEFDLKRKCTHFDGDQIIRIDQLASSMDSRDGIRYVAQTRTNVRPISDEPYFRNVYIKNFGDDLDTYELHRIFQKFGYIRNAKVETDVNGRSRGFGFVHFESCASARLAVQEMDGAVVNGRKLYVGRAQRKSERLQELATMQKEKNFRVFERTNVYVKNLCDKIDDEELTKLFQPFGTITSAKVMRQRSGRSKEFGFVNFSKPEEATRAISNTNGYIFKGRQLYVSLAQWKEERDVILEERRLQREIDVLKASEYNKMLYLHRELCGVLPVDVAASNANKNPYHVFRFDADCSCKDTKEVKHAKSLTMDSKVPGNNAGIGTRPEFYNNPVFPTGLLYPQHQSYILLPPVLRFSPVPVSVAVTEKLHPVPLWNRIHPMAKVTDSNVDKLSPNASVGADGSCENSATSERSDLITSLSETNATKSQVIDSKDSSNIIGNRLKPEFIKSPNIDSNISGTYLPLHVPSPSLIRCSSVPIRLPVPQICPRLFPIVHPPQVLLPNMMTACYQPVILPQPITAANHFPLQASHVPRLVLPQVVQHGGLGNITEHSQSSQYGIEGVTGVINDSVKPKVHTLGHTDGLYKMESSATKINKAGNGSVTIKKTEFSGRAGKNKTSNCPDTEVVQTPEGNKENFPDLLSMQVKRFPTVLQQPSDEGENTDVRNSDGFSNSLKPSDLYTKENTSEKIPERTFSTAFRNKSFCLEENGVTKSSKSHNNESNPRKNFDSTSNDYSILVSPEDFSNPGTAAERSQAGNFEKPESILLKKRKKGAKNSSSISHSVNEA